MIYDALVATFASPARIAAFRSCGAGFWILRKPGNHGDIKIVPDYCHDRFCEPCGRQRQAVIRLNLTDKLLDHPHRFLTLTLRSGPESLTELLDRLLRCFKRLRATTFWKEKVYGGAAFIELTINTDTGAWHPHLHVILDGKWLDHALLRPLWRQITGDSYVIDIRLIRNREKTIHYITKHSTKALPPSVIHDSAALEEAVVALRGRKLCYTFGSWSRWRLLKPPTDDQWETVCHSNELPFRSEYDGDYYDQISICLQAHVIDAEISRFTVTERGPPDPDDDNDD